MFSESFKTQVIWPNQKLRCHPIFALDSEHILLEELFKTKTSSLGPWLHPSTKWFWFSSKWQGEVIKNFGFQLWDPHQMNSVRGYIHVWYATLGVCYLWFMRYVLLNSSSHPSTLELRRTYLMNLRSQTPSVAYRSWTHPLTEFIWWGSQSWDPKFWITSPLSLWKKTKSLGTRVDSWA